MRPRPPCVLIVDADILVRHPLAEYLRECGYRVVQAANLDEARELFTQRRHRLTIDVVLADANAPGPENAFAFAAWMRASRLGVEIILAGGVDAAAEKAGDLCEEGPMSKPYDHQLVLDRIRRSLAARDRAHGEPSP
jgi:DNA-binding response OmpR family regulator